jgi:hypothetical protein
MKNAVFWDVTPFALVRTDVLEELSATIRTPSVYRIPCECNRVYVGQTGRSVDIRLKEHQLYIRLEHPDKSAVAEHRQY